MKEECMNMYRHISYIIIHMFIVMFMNIYNIHNIICYEYYIYLYIFIYT